MFVFVLSVLQDYIYSLLKHTGFYLSESLLYNTLWLFFIPLTVFVNRLIKIVNPKNKLLRFPFNLGIAIAISLLHLLLFASLFVLVSKLIYSPSHRFISMFKTAFSNQFYIALLWYSVFPAIYVSKRSTAHKVETFSEKIKLKIGSKIIPIPASSVQLISTDKPYSVVYTSDQKFLDNKTLKEFETKLDPTIFIRVHRSSILNAHLIETLTSRSNGDYDAVLQNGQMVRLSRHYRKNWSHLLQ